MEKTPPLSLHSSSLSPAFPTPSHHLFLPSLDLIWLQAHYNQRLLFYPAPLASSFSSVVDSLKSSLSQVLVHFYPWAGRLAKGEDGRFVIDCNDAGVEFVEAYIDVSMSDAGEDFQFKPFFKQLVQWSDLEGFDRCDIPLLSVQVTKFADGGIAVGISQSHVVADGHSLWHFMISWAECARGLRISKPPIHERTLLRLEKPQQEKARFYLKLKEGACQEEEAPKASGLKVAVAERVFHFNAETLSRLKSMANAQEGKKPFSSFEVLCAHCWKRVTTAWKLTPEQEMHFAVLANMRSKMVPPLPDTYFGNVIMFTAAYGTVKEVKEESLTSTAERIRGAVQQCQDKTIREMMHWFELRQNSLSGLGGVLALGMNVASSPRFAVYDVDFGWGKPLSVRPARVGGPGEICLFVGKEGGGSMDVCLQLEAPAMELLEKDPLFLSP